MNNYKKNFCVFFDCDECLLHSLISPPNQTHIVLEGECWKYYTVVRPEAIKVIEYARTLVGPDKVYILTAATYDYACQVNEKAGWGFPKSHILAREHASPQRQGYGHHYPTHPQWSKNNVIIDNLPYEWNEIKTSFLGNIAKENYLNVKDYLGVNRPGDTFEEDVYKFLDRKMTE